MSRLKICQSRYHIHSHKLVGTDFSIVISDLEIAALETGESSLEGFTFCPGDTLLTYLLEQPRPISTTSALSLLQLCTQSGHLVQMFMQQMFSHPSQAQATAQKAQCRENPLARICGMPAATFALCHTPLKSLEVVFMRTEKIKCVQKRIFRCF